MSAPLRGTRDEAVRFWSDLAKASAARAADLRRQADVADESAHQMRCHADALERRGVLCDACTAWHLPEDPACPKNRVRP